MLLLLSLLHGGSDADYHHHQSHTAVAMDAAQEGGHSHPLLPLSIGSNDGLFVAVERLISVVIAIQDGIALPPTKPPKADL